MNLICKTVAIEKIKVTSITSGIYVLACIWRDGSFRGYWWPHLLTQSLGRALW